MKLAEDFLVVCALFRLNDERSRKADAPNPDIYLTYRGNHRDFSRDACCRSVAGVDIRAK